MTQHVRTSYRRHRRAARGLAIALAIAVAAVVIPIASGAADKTYTLSVSPSAVCSSANEGEASALVTIVNTAKSASLGSAEIYFPAGSVSDGSGASSRPLSQLDRGARSHYAPVSRPATDCVTLSL